MQIRGGATIGLGTSAPRKIKNKIVPHQKRIIAILQLRKF